MIRPGSAADAVSCRLALNRVPGVGSAIYRRLLRWFGDPAAVFRASRGALAEALAGVPDSKKLAAAIASGPDLQAILPDQRWLEGAAERYLLCLDEPTYPEQLAMIADPPALLFVEGALAALEPPQVAVVGSRSCTALGRELAREFAADLTAAGITVTSGLASGIDSAAHLGAVESGGCTLAVTGNGLDIVYPRSGADLAERIRATGGALVSEFPVGVKPHPGHFPRRNRVIAGLSLGAVVVEADLASGSLITARLAAEQGREVFAIPGSPRNPRARGCNALIRDGATLVQNADQVIEALAPQLRTLLDTAAAKNTDDGSTAADDSFLEKIGFEPFSLDDVVAASGLTPAAVSTKLLTYELDGVIAPSPGGRFIRLK